MRFVCSRINKKVRKVFDMIISAVNSTPIKPQVFKREPIWEDKEQGIVILPAKNGFDEYIPQMEDFDSIGAEKVQETNPYTFSPISDVKKKTDAAFDTLVNADNIKKPIAVAASLALAGILSFSTGKYIGSLVSKVFKKLPQTLNIGLKTVSNKMQDMSGNLIAKEGGKLSKPLNFVGNAVKKAEVFARDAYKKIANSGLKPDADDVAKVQNAFNNIVGATVAASTVLSLNKVDNNEDGAADISQMRVNAYTGAVKNTEKALSLAEKLVALAT